MSGDIFVLETMLIELFTFAVGIVPCVLSQALGHRKCLSLY